MQWIPYEIRNLILSYCLDDELVYSQYHIQTGKEEYRIHWKSNKLIYLQAMLRAKHIYPAYESYPSIDIRIRLYRTAIRCYILFLLHPSRNISSN